MASLSDFRVSVQRDSRVPTLSVVQTAPDAGPKKDANDNGMVSKNADYAKVDKPSLKAKPGKFCLTFSFISPKW